MPEKPPEGPPVPPVASFQELYAAEYKFVWHALWRLHVPNRDLPDLTHRVLFIAFLSWMDYDTTRPLKPWLQGIAFRIASDYHRLARHAYEQFVPNEMLDVVDESSNLEDLAIRRELYRWIDKLGRSLPADRAAIFVQHDLEGIPIPEIARSMNIPVNTAYSRLRLARREIRRQLERRMRKGSPLRAMHLPAGASDPSDGLADVPARLARSARWLVHALIAAAAISIASVIPGGPLAAFPPTKPAVEGAVIPSPRPVTPVKPPLRPPPVLLPSRAQICRLASSLTPAPV
jgi:RNA polymerase sigma-70 factor (ECF subfamily)